MTKAEQILAILSNARSANVTDEFIANQIAHDLGLEDEPVKEAPKAPTTKAPTKADHK